jgi:hypothetical protein
MNKLRAFLIIVVGVFLSTAGPIFLGNVTDVFHTPWSTWTIIISGGVFGLVAYGIAVLAPFTIKPSKLLKLPERG